MTAGKRELILELKRNFRLDIVRSVAITLVVFHHFYVHFSLIPIWNPLILDGGQTGVIMFFLLSGFLITSSFESSLSSYPVKKAIWNYSVSRFLRILPLFWFATSIFYYFKEEIRLFRINPFETSLIDLFGYLFFFNQKLDPLNPVVWTLRLECLFYIFFPLFYFAFRKLKLKASNLNIFFLLSFLFFFLYRYRGVNLGLSEQALQFSTFGNIEGFLLGVFAYYNTKNKYYKKKAFLTLIGVCLLFIFIAYLHESKFYQLYYYPVYRSISNLLIYFFFTLLLMTSGSVTISNNIFKKPIVFISKISYSIYLLHFNIYYNLVFPLLAYLFVSNIVPLYLWSLISILITLFISVASYHFIERPFMYIRKYMLSN